MLACGRRWGKTSLGMVLAASHARAGQRVWWVAPTYSLAFDAWRTFKRKFEPQGAKKIESERHLDLPSGGSITVKSADNTAGLRGVGIDFVVIDEAAFMPEEVWTACIRPALSDNKGGALIISTPAGRNWFFHVFQHGLDPLNEDWQSWTYTTSSNPRIDPQEIADALAITPKRQFQEEYQARFIEGSGTVFRDIKEAATAAYRGGPQPGHTYVMGVDFGRYQDFTALVVIDSTERSVACVDRFNEENWGTQRARIAALAKRWNVTSVLAEANAMGEPNIEALWNQGLPIQSFTTTPHNKPNLIEMLVAAIENRELRLLPDPVLMAELEAYTQHERKSGGYTIYEAPNGVHDDTVIALALAWRLTATPRLTLGIVEI